MARHTGEQADTDLLNAARIPAEVNGLEFQCAPDEAAEREASEGEAAEGEALRAGAQVFTSVSLLFNDERSAPSVCGAPQVSAHR